MLSPLTLPSPSLQKKVMPPALVKITWKHRNQPTLNPPPTRSAPRHTKIRAHPKYAEDVHLPAKRSVVSLGGFL